MTPLGILIQPPVQNVRVRVVGAGDAPVDLRDEDIQPALLQPELGVGVLGLVRVVAADVFGHAPLLPGSVHPNRTDRDLHLAVRLLHRHVQTIDHPVDVVSPPVVQLHLPALILVILVRLLVREVVLLGVGVEIIVQVYPVYIVPVTGGH